MDVQKLMRIAIIPDTNVILAAALEFTYDGTIHTQHQFHVESFQLLDTIVFVHVI